MSTERIEKFQNDVSKLIAEKKIVKIIAEVRRLETWLQKHQTEAVPDNHKQILFSVIESYYNFFMQTKNVEVLDATTSLVDSSLKLPEGKLINAKSKKKALKWLDNLSFAQNTTTSKSTKSKSSNDTQLSADFRYVLLDISEADSTVCVMELEASQSIQENISISTELLSKVKENFENGDNVLVSVDENKQTIVKALINGIQVE